MTQRYFVETPITGGEVKLSGTEAHHMIHVMRAAPGDRTTLFDGSGTEFAARVERVGRRAVELTVLSAEQVDRELPLELTLAVALPKGDRQKWLVEKAVELGLRRIVPLRTDRSVAQPGGQAVERLRRTVVEASKQCGRNRLMEIAEPRQWSQFVSDTRDRPCRLMAHPTGGKSTVPADFPDRVLLAVGPEGGFAEDEVSLAAAAGWQPVDLGPRILRIETAALLLSAIVVQHAG